MVFSRFMPARDAFLFKYGAKKATSNAALCSSYCNGAYRANYVPLRGYKVGKSVGGLNGKRQLVVWAEEEQFTTKVSRVAGVLVVLDGAGDPLFSSGCRGWRCDNGR